MRVFTDAELDRLRQICFLRDLGIGIKDIRNIFADSNSGQVISLLLEQQNQSLSAEIKKKSAQLEDVKEMQKIVRQGTDSISDVASIMKGKDKLKRLHGIMLGIGIPLDIIEASSRPAHQFFDIIIHSNCANTIRAHQQKENST